MEKQGCYRSPQSSVGPLCVSWERASLLGKNAFADGRHTFSEIMENIMISYSRLHNSVNTENSFFGRDVTCLPKKDIFPQPDVANHGSGIWIMTLWTYIQDAFEGIWTIWQSEAMCGGLVVWRGVNLHRPGPLFNQACAKSYAQSPRSNPFTKCTGMPSMIEEADVEYISASQEVKEQKVSLDSPLRLSSRMKTHSSHMHLCPTNSLPKFIQCHPTHSTHIHLQFCTLPKICTLHFCLPYNGPANPGIPYPTLPPHSWQSKCLNTGIWRPYIIVLSTTTLPFVTPTQSAVGHPTSA